MTKLEYLLGDLPDIDPNAVNKLRDRGIKSVEDLWREVGTDFDAGLTQVGQDTGLEREDLLAILAEGAKPRDGKISSIEVLAGLALLLLLIAFGWRLFLIWLPSSAPAGQVVAARDLPAFHVIQDGDVKWPDDSTEVDGLQSVDDILGHYLLQPLASGKALEKDQLSPARLSVSDMADRVIVSIPLEPEALNANTAQGSPATLLLSPRDLAQTGPPASVEVDAIVLKIDELENQVVLTVAIEEASRSELGAMLGMSDIFILQPAR
jgi:hypothetical protein